MKQFIVLVSMIALGIFLFGLIAGDNEDSIFHTLGEVWRQEVTIRSSSP